MIITRKVEFSASHVCRSPRLSEEENRRIYGAAANPNGHGHNYVVEVSLEGEPDPVTGMVLDLKELKEMLNREVVDALRSPLSELRGAAVRPRGPHRGEHRARNLAAPGTAFARGSAAAALHPPVRNAGPVRGLLWRRRAAVFRVTRRYAVCGFAPAALSAT